MNPDLVVIHEHPEWQKPLFAALDKRGVRFEAFNVAQAAFTNVDAARARTYFNQASHIYIAALLTVFLKAGLLPRLLERERHPHVAFVIETKPSELSGVTRPR